MIIFAASPGVAIAVRGQDVAPMSLNIQNWGNIASGGGFATRKAIITAVRFKEADNFQVMHTLRDFIYLHTIGRRIAEISVQGVTFSGSCLHGPASGLTALRQYYSQNRISRRDALLGVEIAGIGFNAFLGDLSADIANPEAGLSSFAMSLLGESVND